MSYQVFHTHLMEYHTDLALRGTDRLKENDTIEGLKPSVVVKFRSLLQVTKYLFRHLHVDIKECTIYSCYLFVSDASSGFDLYTKFFSLVAWLDVTITNSYLSNNGNSLKTFHS